MSFSTALKPLVVFVFLMSLFILFPHSVGAASNIKTISVERKTRCVTNATKALRAKDVKQAVKDGEVFDVEGDEELEKIYQIYLDRLDISWEAMLEPYCGYGSHGVSAAQKSYIKTVTRVRANFLSQVKRIQAEDKDER